MYSRIFCVESCILGFLLKIRELFSLLRAENEETGRTRSLHKCQMEKMPAQRAQGGMGLEQAIIDIRNMYKIYNPGENEVRALDGVSLAVYKGEFVAIVGHSGSGKSTLMNMIGCLDTPTSGTYFLNGQDVSALSDNALSAIRNEQIGFIFQSFNLIKNLNAHLPGPARRKTASAGVGGPGACGPCVPYGPPSKPDVRRPAAACGRGSRHRGTSAAHPRG